MKRYTMQELEAMPTTNPKGWRELARTHGMTTKLDSYDDILNAIIGDGTFYDYHDPKPQGTFKVTWIGGSATFHTMVAAERFCIRFDQTHPGEEITDTSY